MSEKGKKNKKQTGLGLAIWLLLFLIILIVFLVKQEEIKDNFNKSGATALIEKKIGKEIFEDKPETKKEEEKETIIDLKVNHRNYDASENKNQIVENSSEEAPVKENSEAVEIKESNEDSKNESQKIAEKQVSSVNEEKQEEKITQSEEIKNSVKANEKKSEEVEAISKKTQTQPIQEANTLKKKICFVAIDSDGPVIRKEVTRSVRKDSPMADALNMLLAGPSDSEEKTGCRSLIPAGTRLLSASVKGGVAKINFSEEFQFNQFGVEGSLAQLMQVVYTATEFSTVNSVQILIEGQKRDYLTEGVWIGSPLSRNSF